MTGPVLIAAFVSALAWSDGCRDRYLCSRSGGHLERAECTVETAWITLPDDQGLYSLDFERCDFVCVDGDPSLLEDDE